MGEDEDDDDDEELAPQECQFEHRERCKQDHCIKLPIPGQINSSTRSEAHGLLVALCTKGPVHIGIDNKAVVDKANFLLVLATKLCIKRDNNVDMQCRIGLAFENARKLRKPERKHWQMQKDGDVWAAIWNAIIQKRPQAIKVAKVKGHATEEDVQAGRATEADKMGNAVADSLVGDATRLHGKRLADLAHWLEARHKAYQAFMTSVLRFIIKMLTADKEERDRRAKAANPFETTVTPKLGRSSSSTGSTLVCGGWM